MITENALVVREEILSQSSEARKGQVLLKLLFIDTLASWREIILSLVWAKSCYGMKKAEGTPRAWSSRKAMTAMTRETYRRVSEGR